MPVLFDEIARLPMPGDNVAIVTQPLDAGTNIQVDQDEIVLSNGLLE